VPPQHDEGEPRAHERTRERGQRVELLLKNSVELEAEQNLRAEDQRTAFIEGYFELPFKLHDPQENGASIFYPGRAETAPCTPLPPRPPTNVEFGI
jgi:hypothetical protein